MSRADNPLSATEIAELRHDLRTPFNALIGYSEMLLEVAADEGLDAIIGPLQAVHATARDLLAVVNAALAPGTAVRRADLVALAGQVNDRLGPVAGHLDAVADCIRAAGKDEMLQDVERLRGAAGNLTRLAAGRLLTGGAAPAAPQPITPSAQGVAPAAADTPARGVVLVVDDNENNRHLLCRRLEREGYAAREAADGREALALLHGGGFDLVLLDILMPEVDGYEVLRQVKSSPELRDLPVIMISALDEIDSVVRCIETGAEDYLPKPFDPVLLRARVGACLEKKRLRDKELEYLRGVAAVQDAASAVESGAFDPASLEAVAGRPDELGRLARVFQRMAREVQAREQRLRDEVTQLRIEVDEARKARQVAEITSSGFFEGLQQKAERLRRRMGKDG